MIEEQEIFQDQDPPTKKPKFNPKAAYSPVKEDKPSFDPNKPFEKKKDLENDSEPIVQNSPTTTSTSKFVVNANGNPALEALNNPRSLNTPQVADQTNLPKPISDIDVKEKLRLAELHNLKINEAINNTVDKRLKLKGIKAAPGSSIYNEERRKLEKAVKNGDATYHMDMKTGKPGLDRTLGKWEAFVKGFDEANQGNDEAEAFTNTMTTAEQVAFANRKAAERPVDEYVDERASGLSGLTHMGGGAVPFVGRMVAGGIIGAAAVAAAPESLGASIAGLPTALGFIFTANDMKNHGVMDETLRRFEILRNEHPEANQEDLMREAKESASVAGAIAGIAENTLFSGIGGKVLKTPLSSETKNVLKKVAKGTFKSATDFGKISAGIDVGKNIEGNLEGYKTSPEQVVESGIDKFIEGATTGAMLHLMTAGVTGVVSGIPKVIKSIAKYSLKDTPIEEISETLKLNEEAGIIPEGSGEKVVKDIKGYNAALSKVNPDGLSEESKISIAGLIQSKENLVKESETKDESVRQPYKDKIEAINLQVQEIQRTNKPLEHEVDDVTGQTLAKPTFDDVAKNRVEDLADKISKGKRVEDVVDIQVQENFPEELNKQLKKILREEKSKNKDKETPNTELSGNIEKYLEKQPKSTGQLLKNYKEENANGLSEMKDDDVLKMIAEQAQNIVGGEYSKLSTPEKSYESALRQIPKELVDTAIEKYPAESLLKKEEVVSEQLEPINPTQQLEKERDEKIRQVMKPEIKLELLQTKDLVDSKDPIGNKEIHDNIKERYKDIREIVECLFAIGV